MENQKYLREIIVPQTAENHYYILYGHPFAQLDNFERTVRGDSNISIVVLANVGIESSFDRKVIHDGRLVATSGPIPDDIDRWCSCIRIPQEHVRKLPGNAVSIANGDDGRIVSAVVLPISSLPEARPVMKPNYNDLRNKNADSPGPTPEIKMSSKTGTGLRKIKLLQSIPLDSNKVFFITATRSDYPGKLEAFPNISKLKSYLKDKIVVKSVFSVRFLTAYSTMAAMVMSYYFNGGNKPWILEKGDPAFADVIGEGYIVTLDSEEKQFPFPVDFDDYKLHIINLREFVRTEGDQQTLRGLELFITDLKDDGSDLLQGMSRSGEASSSILEGKASRDLEVQIYAEEGVQIPEYATVGSAGFDLRAHFPEESFKIEAGSTVLVSTGLVMAIPEGYELQIRSRSGWSLKGLVVNNSPGTVDSDFRSTVRIILHNQTPLPITIARGERIAQGVLCPVYRARFQVVKSVDSLGRTERGAGGFGSTGTK